MVLSIQNARLPTDMWRMPVRLKSLLRHELLDFESFNQLAWGLFSAILVLLPIIELVSPDSRVAYVAFLFGLFGSPMLLFFALRDALVSRYRYCWLVVLAAAAATTYWGRMAGLW